MSLQEPFVIKSDITDNTKPIGYNAELIGIAEMSIDIHLLDCLVGGSMSWHGAISSFVRIIGIIKVMGFLESL